MEEEVEKELPSIERVLAELRLLADEKNSKFQDLANTAKKLLLYYKSVKGKPYPEYIYIRGCHRFLEGAIDIMARGCLFSMDGFNSVNKLCAKITKENK